MGRPSDLAADTAFGFLESAVAGYKLVIAERDKLQADIERIGRSINLDPNCIPSAFLRDAYEDGKTFADVIIEVLDSHAAIHGHEINAHAINEAAKRLKRKR